MSDRFFPEHGRWPASTYSIHSRVLAGLSRMGLQNTTIGVLKYFVGKDYAEGDGRLRKGYCWVGNAEASKELGMSPRMMRYHLTALASKGLIERDGNGGRSSSPITILHWDAIVDAQFSKRDDVVKVGPERPSKGPKGGNKRWQQNGGKVATKVATCCQRIEDSVGTENQEEIDAHASASARASITIGQAEEEPTVTDKELRDASKLCDVELSDDRDVNEAILGAALAKRERKQSQRTTANPPIPSLPSLDTPMPKAPSAIAALWASIALCYKREGLIAELTPKLHAKATKLLTECPLSMEEMEAIYAKLDRLDFGDRSVDIRLRKIDFALTGDGRNAILAAASSYTDGINSFQGLPLDKPFAELGGVNWRKALPMSEFHLSDHFDNHLEAYNAMTRMLKTARGVRNFRKAVNDVYMAGRRVHLNQWAELARIAQSDATMECNERKMHEQLEGGRNRD